MAGSGLGQAVAVPEDKNLSRTWLRSLASRGTPTEYTGAALQRIGMPVGGLCTGQVYLSGDGRLWMWDVFNADPFNSSVFPIGAAGWAGGHYANPRPVTSPFTTGFALRWDAAGGPQTKPLDAAGFTDVGFRGTYPIAEVSLADSGCPVDVDLAVFSPFVPTSAADSSFPATVMEYTVRNTSSSAFSGELLGVLENPIGVESRRGQAIELSTERIDVAGGDGLQHAAAPIGARSSRPDVLVEDWEGTDYTGWTASGTAFGSRPVTEDECPSWFRREGDLQVEGTRFATSHNFHGGGNYDDADAHTGTLVSDLLTIERTYLGVRVSGGSAAALGIRLVVDGTVVGEVRGTDSEVFQTRFIDARSYVGQTGTIEIFDQYTGGWGHVNVDTIWLTDNPRYGDRPARPDVLVEDWESLEYAGWTASGTAFGPGPVTEDECPTWLRRERPIGVKGTRFATSHNFHGDGNYDDADAHTGTLVSDPISIERRYLGIRVSGGSGSAVGVRVRVNGSVVETFRGTNSEVFRSRFADLGAYEGQNVTIEIFDQHTGGWGHINVDRIWFSDVAEDGDRPDIPFERWERTTYSGWEVTGTAFGAGPVTEGQCPPLFRREGSLNVEGSRFVTSYNFRASGTAPDDHQGRLRSSEFVVQRRYLKARVSGGSGENVGLRLVVDGQPVAWLRGHKSEIFTTKVTDISEYEGKTARIEIVDAATGSWAHVNVDSIWFSDEPTAVAPWDYLGDIGTFGLVAYDDAAQVRTSISEWSTPAEWFDSADRPDVVNSAQSGMAGTVGVPVQLAPGESRTIRFALGWYLPNLNYRLFKFFRENYQVRHHHFKDTYDDARQVLDVLGGRGDDLADATRRFVQTWYEDSTLPYWFLERTLAPASTLATATAYRFSDGRFYGNEGIYCCQGTCTHVWNYAQSVGRLFPELERDTRERVDYDLGFNESTGVIGYRGEAIRNAAADGQAGTILRTYREHQMSPDGAFLDRVWPDVKKAMQYLISADGEPDGTLEGPQHNTLDAAWYGEIPWISGLYVAALLATAEMADESGDASFAQQCRSLASSGSARLDNAMWNSQYGYYEHLVDPAHPDSTNTNRGCHIDQLFGQMYAHQLGLPRVFGEQKCRTALANMFQYNFLPDPHGYKDESGIDGGRIYSTSGEAGTIMCTWPFGGSDTAPGSGSPGFVGYFNEVWTGQEYQFAAGLMAEGMVDEALAVTRAVHDRHSAEKRNPYNEIECSDHYARGMASHAVFLAACGYEYHGPRGHLGFAPKMTPEDFAAPFTVAAGWGLYRQSRTGTEQVGEIEMRYGQVTLRSVALELAEPPGTGGLSVQVEKVADGQPPVAVSASTDVDGTRVVVTFASPVTLAGGETLVTTAVRG